MLGLAGTEGARGGRNPELSESIGAFLVLDDKHGIRFMDRLARLRQALEFAPLLEDRRFRRIQVFGLA